MVYACIRVSLLRSRWAERPLMSKTVAEATISTKCGFTNGAAELLYRQFSHREGVE